MLKKMIGIGITVLISLAAIGLMFSNPTLEQNSEESKITVKGDVIMPTKVSRPGCDKVSRCYIPTVIVIRGYA